MSTISIASYAQSMTKLEATKLLHESISNTEWSLEDGPEFCNKTKFIKAIENGGDLNSQSEIYHQKKIHQNVLNRALSYSCLEIVDLILDKYLPSSLEEVTELVNDPKRALNTTPVKKTINKGFIGLFQKLILDFPIDDDPVTLARKISKQNEIEMAKILMSSSAIDSLDEINRAIVIAARKNHIEILKTFLVKNKEIERLSDRNLLKLKEKSMTQSEEVKKIIYNY